jgi:hypothetical protein
MNKIISIFLILAVFSIAGCALTGSSSDSPVSSIAQAMPAGNANLKVALEVPEMNVAPSLRASATGAQVHVSLNMIVNGAVIVIKRVVPVINGSATFEFQGLPEGSTLGEIHIEGGNVGGHNDFHGALDLGAGSNTLHASPIGSGMGSDILATVFNEYVKNPAMIKAQATNIIALITQISQENSLATQPLTIFGKLVEHIKPQGTIIIKSSSPDSITAYNSTDSEIWTTTTAALFKNIPELSTALTTIKFVNVIKQGFGTDLLVAWKDESNELFIVSKINSSDGTLDKYLLNRGNCLSWLITNDNQILVGGYYVPQKCPMVLKWSGNENADTGETGVSEAKGLEWLKTFTGFSADGEKPSVRNLSFSNFSGLTAIIEDAATYRVRSIELNFTDGSYDLSSLPQKFSVNAIAGYEQNTLLWQANEGSTYNLYWSFDQDVATSSATAIKSVSSPYEHTGLENGKTLYYLLEETNKSGLILTSYEVLATPDASLNQAPRVRINSPLNGQTFLSGGESVTVSVFAADPDGSIASVTLTVDGKVVGNLSSAPYSFNIGALTIGEHVVYAIASDNNGASTKTQSTTFKIVTDITGEEFTNKITGHLKDRNQQPISGAIVGIAATQIYDITDATGYFALENLAPGLYTIVISRDGYVNRTIPGVRVE